MRLEASGSKIVLVLSRRNLKTLLAKLDGHPPNSRCMIEGGVEASGMLVKAEEDKVHYAHRPPGTMHPDTEIMI